MPDGTIVKWELEKKILGQDRPFYSTNPLGNIEGVYSTTANGVARSVFFGPASDVQPTLIIRNDAPQYVGEIYDVMASVVYDGDSVAAEEEAICRIASCILVNESWASFC